MFILTVGQYGARVCLVLDLDPEDDGEVVEARERHVEQEGVVQVHVARVEHKARVDRVGCSRK